MERVSSSCKKNKLQIVSIVLFLVWTLVLSQSVSGATLSLTARWTPNTDPDMAGYNLFRTDGTRVKINSTLIPFRTGGSPTATYNFSVTVPDQSAGTLTFVLDAVDSSNNQSTDSNLAAYNYDLTLQTFTISGNAGVASATLSYTDGTSKTATADGSGNYSFTVSNNWSGTVTPSKSGYSFSPTSRSYSNVTSNQTGQNYTGTLGEAISVPATPSRASSGVSWSSTGDSNLYTGTSYKFSTSGSSSNLGSSGFGSSHPVEYQFDWGDGALSSWGSSSWGPYSQSNLWTVVKTYAVRARARCKKHPDMVSPWSNALSVPVKGKPFIRVTSPNGGENLVVGSSCTITWDSTYLNPDGAIYLFYKYDGAWHPIATLSPNSISFNWTIPRIPANVTSPAPASSTGWSWSWSGSTSTSTSIWIGSWSNGKWECYDSSDYSFRVLFDGWVCKISGGDQGGATLLFDEAEFGGYGVSLGLGMFGIEGTYSVNSQGGMSGAYTIYEFANPVNVIYSGYFSGSVDSGSKKLTLALTTLDGTPVFSLSGARLSNVPAIPGQWVANLSGSASGSLTSLEIDPYQLGDDLYSYVFEFSGSGSITGGGSINITGYFYLTSTTVSFFNKTNVYGIYKITGAVDEVGVFTGSLNLSSRTISFAMTSSANANKHTLTGNGTY